MPSWTDAHVAALALVAVVSAASLYAGREVSVGSAPVAACAAVAPRPAFRPAAEEVRPAIGLVPSADANVTAALVRGATRALDAARAAGGPDLRLVVGAARGRWDSAASEAVRLACEEHVVALIAPPDRETAHAVAQAATRCRVPLLSTSPAPGVTAAGSTWVLAVVACGDPAARAPEETWVAAGADAAAVAAEAVRRAGLSRDAFVAAVRNGTPVTGATGPLTFDARGRRVPAAK